VEVEWGLTPVRLRFLSTLYVNGLGEDMDVMSMEGAILERIADLDRRLKRVEARLAIGEEYETKGVCAAKPIAQLAETMSADATERLRRMKVRPFADAP
jgi:hypothetical protein